MNIIDTLKRQFNQTLQREKQLIRICETNKLVDVFFRKNNDNNNISNYITMFYNDNTIHQGSTIQFKDKKYLILNCETDENNIYKKSAIIDTNSSIIVNDSKLPVFVGDVNAPLATNGNIISMVSGWIELRMEDNSLSKQIKLNDVFNLLDGSYQITNLVRKNGMRICYGERTGETESKYALEVTDIPRQYNVGDTVNLTSKLYKDDVVCTEPHTIVWSCLDDNSTITSEGQVTILKGNHTTITAQVTHNDKVYKTSIVLSIGATEEPVIPDEPDEPVEPTVTLSSIAITTPPTKTEYTVGDTVDITGMVVTATYSDSSTNVITDYTYAPTTALTATDTAITITYQGKTITTPITVSEPVVAGNKATITGRADVKIGSSARTYTANFTDGAGNPITLTPVWSFEYSMADTEQYLTIAYPTADTVTVAAQEGVEDLIGETVTIKLTDTTNSCNSELVVTFEFM